MTPAKNFGAFMSSEDVAAWVMQYAQIGKGMMALEPSAGTGVLATAARASGALVNCVEIQPGLADELRVLHGFEAGRQADFLTLPQTPIYDRIVMNPPVDRGSDRDQVRHAFGIMKTGGILVAGMNARGEFAT